MGKGKGGRAVGEIDCRKKTRGGSWREEDTATPPLDLDAYAAAAFPRTFLSFFLSPALPTAPPLPAAFADGLLTLPFTLPPPLPPSPFSA